MPLHAVVLLCAAGLACLAPADALRAGLALHPGRASISPAQFRVLNSINNIEERELSMLMSAAAEDGGRSRSAGRSKAQEDAALARFMRTQAMSGGEGGKAGGVPGICPAPCKSAWASLTTNYKTYFECQPKCAETVIKEKTKYSDMIDKECLQLGACWEAIEAEIFRPGSASGEGSGVDEDEEAAGAEAGDGDGGEDEGAGLNADDGSDDEPVSSRTRSKTAKKKKMGMFGNMFGKKEKPVKSKKPYAKKKSSAKSKKAGGMFGKWGV